MFIDDPALVPSIDHPNIAAASKELRRAQLQERRLREKPWTFESVAVLFVTGGGFKGIADAHNKAMK